MDRRESANLKAKYLLKISLIALGSLVTEFPTLEYLVKFIGLAFVDFLPIMLFITSQVFSLLVGLA